MAGGESLFFVFGRIGRRRFVRGGRIRAFTAFRGGLRFGGRGEQGGAHHVQKRLQNARFRQYYEHGDGDDHVAGDVHELVDERVHEGVGGGQVYPDRVFGKVDHAGEQVHHESRHHGEHRAEHYVFHQRFAEMARKAHQADHRKGEDVIEYKGEGREDVRRGEEVEHAEDDAHQKALGRAVGVGIDEYGHPACQRDRAAVRYGRNFHKREHERGRQAHRRIGERLRVEFFGVAVADAHGRHDDRQHADDANRNVRYDVGRLFAHFEQVVEKHKKPPLSADVL